RGHLELLRARRSFASRHAARLPRPRHLQSRSRGAESVRGDDGRRASRGAGEERSQAGDRREDRQGGEARAEHERRGGEERASREKDLNQSESAALAISIASRAVEPSRSVSVLSSTKSIPTSLRVAAIERAIRIAWAAVRPPGTAVLTPG